MKNTKRFVSMILAAAMILGMGSSAFAASEVTEPVNMVIASTSAGSSNYTNMAAETKLFSEKLPAGSTITQETISSGSSTNGYLIENGMCDYASGENAVSGTVGVDNRGPYTAVRALFSTVIEGFVAQLATQSYVDKTGYSTIGEVVENKAACRFVAEPVGSSDYVSFMYLLEIHGVTVEDIESWGGSVTFTDGSACCDMLQDGQADMMVGHTSAESSSLTELCMSTDMVVTGLNDEEIAGMKERGYAESVIPAGCFNVTTEEQKSACQATSRIVSADMSDDLAYTLTKIVVENMDTLAEELPSYRDLTYDVMVSEEATVVPLHPGAIAYFQEIGVLDADGNYIEQ